MTLTNSHRTHSIIVVTEILLLVASWLALFAVLIVASWSLTPFDAVPPQRIPTGWQRDLNAFVLNTWLTLWIPAGIVGSSVTLFVSSARRNAIKQHIAPFILSNALCILAMIVLSIPIAFLPGFAPAPGYGYVAKYLLKDFLLVGILLYFQAKGQ